MQPAGRVPCRAERPASPERRPDQDPHGSPHSAEHHSGQQRQRSAGHERHGRGGVGGNEAQRSGCSEAEDPGPQPAETVQAHVLAQPGGVGNQSDGQQSEDGSDKPDGALSGFHEFSGPAAHAGGLHPIMFRLLRPGAYATSLTESLPDAESSRKTGSPAVTRGQIRRLRRRSRGSGRSPRRRLWSARRFRGWSRRGGGRPGRRRSPSPRASRRRRRSRLQPR